MIIIFAALLALWTLAQHTPLNNVLFQYFHHALLCLSLEKEEGYDVAYIKNDGWLHCCIKMAKMGFSLKQRERLLYTQRRPP